MSSYHLNPFEHFWDVIGKEVRRWGSRNVRQLQQFVVDDWYRTAQRSTSEVRGFYAQSFPGRHSSKWRSYRVLIDKLTISINGIVVVIVMNKFRNLILMQLNEMEVV